MSILPASGIGDESTGFYTETIDQSLRFDGSSSELNITPSSTGNRRTFTTSLWVKRSKISSSMEFHTGGSNAGGQLSTQFGINSSDQLQFYDVLAGVTNYAYVRSSNLLTDTTNWYHIVLAVDTTQSTNSDRVKLYINGSEVSYVSSPTYPDQNHQTVRNNSGTLTRIGRFPNVAVNYFNGYIAEFNHIDGTALTPSSFGETKNGVWIPKAISGLTYGTNGFRLTFADSSDIGNNANSSDGTNDHSVSGLAATDVVADSPTNNFCTLNPLSGNSHTATLSEGALKASGADQAAIGTFGMTTGKWYWEGRCGAIGGSNFIGVVKMDYEPKDQGSSHSDGRTYANNGYIYVKDASSSGSTGTTYTTGDIIGVAVDLDNGTVKWYKNGTVNTNSEVTDLNSHADGDQGWLPWTNFGNATGDFVLNFGQDGSFAGLVTAQGNADGNGQGNFYYSPPSGYVALCSANLPDVTIGADRSTQADDHFNTVLYTGDGQTTQDVTGVGFKPDFTWGKERNSTSGNWLVDSSRGYENFLSSQTYNDESTGITNNNASRSNDGFQTTNSGASNELNKTYASWNWKANGGTTTTNDASATGVGTIDSVIQANQTAGFSIITYTGTGTAGTIAHGLGATPSLLLTKNRTWDHEYSAWLWWHHKRDNAFASSTNYAYLNLSSSGGTSTTSFYRGDQINSTVFGVYTNDAINDASYNYVTYAWAEIDGYSRMGTYSGNSSADGVFVFTGFRPAWLIIKRMDSGQTGQWFIMDNKRLGYNGANYRLLADASNEEYTGTSSNIVDFLSNGFKTRTTSSNTNTGTYMYMAFADQAFKFSNAR